MCQASRGGAVPASAAEARGGIVLPRKKRGGVRQGRGPDPDCAANLPGGKCSVRRARFATQGEVRPHGRDGSSVPGVRTPEPLPERGALFGREDGLDFLVHGIGGRAELRVYELPCVPQ